MWREFSCTFKNCPTNHCCFGFLCARGFSQTFHTHEYSVQIRRSDSSMKNRARALGSSESRGEDLGTNYSSDAVQISLGKVASIRRRFTDGGTKNVAPRRSNFRKGTRKTNQVRLVTVRLEECCKVILGGLKNATCYEAVTLNVVCKSPLHSTEIVVFFQRY